MPDNGQTRALAQLFQWKRLQAIAERREALAAAARVSALDRHIETIDSRIAAEADVLADYADAPALGRWVGLMDGKRDGLLHRWAAEQRQALALAASAAAADTAAEQHKELLDLEHRKLRDQQQRARERAEWEALALLFASPPGR